MLAYKVLFYGGLSFGALVSLIVLFGSWFVVEQQTLAVVERLGRFLRVAGPGFHFKWPVLDAVRYRPSLRVQQVDLKVETKTKDDVFAVVRVAVQYRVQANKAREAVYELVDVERQVSAFVFDVVRARVPAMTIDEAFERKDEIASAVSADLRTTMAGFGIEITTALVVDVEPDAAVKAAMNEKNAQKRLREAASEKGEGERILMVKAAQAEAESKKLQGEGIAGQRMAIASGLRDSLKTMHEAGVSPQEATQVMLMTQWLDTLRDVGARSGASTILLPHSPGAVGALMQEIAQAVAVGQRTEVKGRTL